MTRCHSRILKPFSTRSTDTALQRVCGVLILGAVIFAPQACKKRRTSPRETSQSLEAGSKDCNVGQVGSCSDADLVQRIAALNVDINPFVEKAEATALAKFEGRGQFALDEHEESEAVRKRLEQLEIENDALSTSRKEIAAKVKSIQDDIELAFRGEIRKADEEIQKKADERKTLIQVFLRRRDDDLKNRRMTLLQTFRSLNEVASRAKLVDPIVLEFANKKSDCSIELQIPGVGEKYFHVWRQDRNFAIHVAIPLFTQSGRNLFQDTDGITTNVIKV